MPLVQGGPPEWIWERPAERLKWEITRSQPSEGREDFELRINCGLEFMRLQFFTQQEIEELQSVLESLAAQSTSRAESGEPGGGRGRVDRTGVVPAGVRIDPDITEGHPGYAESGPSEFKPR